MNVQIRQGDPFHAGERAAQSRVGVREHMAAQGSQVVRDFMPEQHREFFPLLSYLPVAVLDGKGWPVGTILTGQPGFVSSPDPRVLRVAAMPQQGDPAAAGFVVGATVGILGIDLVTRRRNRLNGRIAAIDASGFSVAVEQSFGNCPQYIQSREVALDGSATRGATETLAALDDAARSLIGRSDTCFVASSAGPAGVDMSHRGGRPGFVRVIDDELTVPDFSGNRYFNTLGNFLVDPRAALLFPDFANGDVLQVNGRAEIVWDGEEVSRFVGAQRLWRMRVSRAWRIRGALPFRWSFRDYAREIARTGTWTTA